MPPLLTTENEVAAVPVNRTWVVPVKPEPLIVTAVPTFPLVGLNPAMFGAPVELVTVKSP